MQIEKESVTRKCWAQGLKSYFHVIRVASDSPQQPWGTQCLVKGIRADPFQSTRDMIRFMKGIRSDPFMCFGGVGVLSKPTRAGDTLGLFQWEDTSRFQNHPVTLNVPLTGYACTLACCA